VTTTTAVAGRIVTALGEALRRRGGEQLEDLVDGLAAPIADADRRIASTSRGWASAFDLDTTPEPKWIGSAIGSPLPGGLTIEQQREYIRDRAYWRRGTPGAIRGAVGALLSGSRRVDLFERDGGPWRLRVRTYAAETPDDAVGAVAAAAASQKPVGIVLEAETVTGASWDHLMEVHGTWDDVLAEFGTWDTGPTPDADTVVYHVPEEGTDV
jgi:hypothetical protein